MSIVQALEGEEAGLDQKGMSRPGNRERVYAAIDFECTETMGQVR